MAKMIILLAAVALVGVLAEPPVGNSYLPPSNGGYSGALSSTYGAPSRSSRLGNGRSGSALSRSRLGSRAGSSARYSASGASGRLGSSPSSVYGAPVFGGNNGAFRAPSSQYGAPNGGNSGAYNTPSSQYGAPGFGGNGGFGGASGSLSAPSSQYGAPGFGGNGGASGAFRAPSSQYGAPLGGSSYAAAAAGRQRSNGLAPVYGAPYAGAYSDATEDPLAEPANYEFSYEVQDAESGNDFGHQESRQDEQALGEYRVTLPDGRTQIVEYEANENGYNPNIRYEETPEGAAAAQRSAQIRNAAQGGYSYGRGQGGPY